MKSFDKASANVKDVRAAMNGRIGEIISTVVGDDTLQAIFEQPEHNEAYIKANEEGKPSGIIALDLGIVDRDTKNALLVAQAAERTVINAERALAIKDGAQPEESWGINNDDDVFKYVGSDRDPQQLQEAQASWQISQIWLNERIHEATRNPENQSYANSVYLFEGKEDFSGALLKAAAKYYNSAATTLEQKGFADAAERLRAVSDSVNPENAAEINVTPHDIANAALWAEQSYRQDMLIALGSDHYTGGPEDNASETLAKKLIALTETQKEDPTALNAAPKSTPPGGSPQ